MLSVTSFMFAGLLVGLLLRKVDIKDKVNRCVFAATLALLFLLGCEVGANEQIISNIGKLGGQALIFATMATLGSILAGWFVYNRFFRRK